MRSLCVSGDGVNLGQKPLPGYEPVFMVRAQNVRFGRIAEVVENAAVLQRWRSPSFGAREIDFCFTPNNRHDIGDVGFGRINFRC